MHSTNGQLKNTIGGVSIGAKVGSVILMDAGRYFRLDACELPEFADFRANGLQLPVALNVHVTGRTLQRKAGDLAVRVRIQAVGDCEPDQNFGAWMLYNSSEIS